MSGEAIIVRYGKALRAFLSARLPSEEVDDAFQDVCEAVLRGASRANDPGKWAFGLARHEVFARYRSGARDRAVARRGGDSPMEEIEDGRSIEEAVLGEIEEGERRAAFEACLQTLPPRYYAAIRLYLELGCDCKALAASLSCEYATARWRLHMAKRMLVEAARKKGFANERDRRAR